jgi:F-type H+-transporting ATPase subunit a
MATEGGHEGGSGFNIHPMDQFRVHPLFGGTEVHWYTPTNATLWMLLVVGAIALLMVVGSRGRQLVPSRAQSAAEVTYGFVRKMVEDIAGKEGMKYFPYIFTVFLFILFANLLALIPASFSPTSHIAVTALLAIGVFVTVTVIGFVKHGAHFLNLFWVSSAPTLALRIVLAVIEVISYFVRPLSHSIRLAGNLMAGHAVLKVFAGFAGALGAGAVIPIVAITAIYGLELLVACIQAYVFTILTVVYLNDALHPGH